MRTALLLPLLFLSCPFASAQDSALTEEVGGRRAWFVATHMPKDLANPITVMVGGDFHQVMLSKRRASAAVGIGAEQVVKVVLRVPIPDKPDEFSIRVLAQAAIPKEVKQALLILVPADKPEGDIRFHVRVQDLARYRGGDYLFLNLTPKRIAIVMAGERLGAKPGGSCIFDASSIKTSTNAEISYHYYDAASREWRLISASTVVLRPTRREICIFSWDARYRRMDYHGITFPVEP